MALKPQPDAPVAEPPEHFDRLISPWTTATAPVSIIAIGLSEELLGAIDRRQFQTKVLAIEPVLADAQALARTGRASQWIRERRLQVIAGPAFAGAADAWSFVGPCSPPPPMLVSPALEVRAPDGVASAKAVAQRIVLGARANDEARKAFAGRYLLNSVRNLPVVAAEGDVASLTDAFSNIPCIVVAAGPSLDDNCKEIAAVANRALIVAVDTAVKPLLSAGVPPHLIVAVDPSEINARHLIGLEATDPMHLVAEASLDPRVFGQFAGRTFTFKVSDHHPWPWLQGLDADRGSLKAWGSVLTTAFDLACLCGCSPIVFAGADLAYTGGQLYCTNTAFEPDWQHMATRVERAEHFDAFIRASGVVDEPDIQGRMVRTAPRFVQFRNWIVERAGASGRPVFNATGGGILHGAAITQRSIASLSLPGIEGGTDRLRRRVQEAHAVSSADRVGRKTRLLTSVAAEPPTVPFEQWMAFGGDTASADDLRSALAASERGLRKLIPRDAAGYLAMQQDWYNERANSLQEAEWLVHADIEHARMQAPATQAHVLLELLQRTYEVEPGLGVHGTLLAASSLRGERRALDLGCGIGRSMEPLVAAGVRVDGVDFSERMMAFARGNPRLANSSFFLSSGSDCGAAPESAYDLVYSGLFMQHIGSRAIRNQLFAACARSLKPGGVIWIQLNYYPELRRDEIPAPHVPWSIDDFNAPGANGVADVWITPDELHLVLDDFSRHFVDLRLQFIDFPPEIILFTNAARFSHLVVSGSKDHTMASRIYAPAIKPRVL